MSTRELVTISFSHYCEKARWALDRSGLPYRERAALPVFHLPVAWRALGRSGAGRATAHSTRLSTPILVTDGRPISGSTAIVRRAAPELFAGTEEEEALIARFDDELGPHTRRVAYHFIFGTPGVLGELADANASRAQALAFRAASPLLAPLMRRGLGIHERGYRRSLEKVEAIAGEVAALLADGRPYLSGARFGAADLTFAALFAPAVLPAEYGAVLPLVERFDTETRASFERFRAHPAGQFAMRVYREERRRAPREPAREGLDLRRIE